MSELTFAVDDDEVAVLLAQVLRRAQIPHSQVRLQSGAPGGGRVTRGIPLESMTPELIQVVVGGLVTGSLAAVAQIVATFFTHRGSDWEVTITNSRGESRTLKARRLRGDKFQAMLQTVMQLSADDDTRPHEGRPQRRRSADS